MSVVFEATPLVVTVKVAKVAFAATVTLVGTCAAGLLLESVTIAPPDGAGPVSVTVPTDEAPAGTEVGFRLRDERAGRVTVKLALWVDP